MLFNSFNFLVFFTLIVIAYYILPHKFRWALLLAGSYYFYMCWRAELIVLIIFSTFINYLSSIKISESKDKKTKKHILLFCLAINFGLLFVFKYMNFFSDTIVSVIDFFGGSYTPPEFDIILPMGISFFTFQASAYTIDVYCGKIKAIHNYGKFSLFIAFFPQLVAGPIERSENLLPQFYKKQYFSLPQTSEGLKYMLWGFLKKVVIADRASVAVNAVFNNAHSFSGLYLVIAALLFSLQIYCDFSGYSDIAKGSAKILGFDLMDNFRRPFISKSIKEFWRRWHISLSSWFMDYVYIPLGGNRNGNLKKYRNLLITFMVSGLWHGANWTFVIWGGMHGIFIVLYNILAETMYSIRKNIGYENITPVRFVYNLAAAIFTFGLVVFAFIFFRANSVEDGFYIISHMLWNFRIWFTPQYLFDVFTGMSLNLYEWCVLLSAVVFLALAEISCGDNIHKTLDSHSFLLRLIFYTLAAVFVLTTGVFYNAGEFIYFQF